MAKVAISSNAFTYPMPVVLVGSIIKSRANFAAVAWVTRANRKPPMLAVALGPHHTNEGIHAHGEFSANVPGVEMFRAVDYCGLVSGRVRDKSLLFATFRGELEFAPMIELCPVTMECRLVQAIALPSNTLFIGEIVGAYCEEHALTDGLPDIQKVEPFTLSMPDNRYWRVGQFVGQAWSSGRDYAHAPHQ